MFVRNTTQIAKQAINIQLAKFMVRSKNIAKLIGNRSVAKCE